MSSKARPAGFSSARRAFPPTTALSGPERLVGVGFRCWLGGYRTGDIGCWVTGWNAYTKALGPTMAKEALGELASWVRLVQDAARRKIEVCPVACPGFCRDECLAIAVVAASQHGVCPAMQACAVALLDNPAVEEVVDGARGFAIIMRLADQVLSPAAMIEASRPESTSPGVTWH